jgi:hypothetical protein
MLTLHNFPVLAALAINAACRPQAAALSSADRQALRDSQPGDTELQWREPH